MTLLTTRPVIKLAHLSLALAGLMWVLPFLNYYHAYPLTTFYQEWSTAALGLAAALLLLTKRYWQDAEVPRVVALPLALLLLLLVQYGLGKIPYLGQMLLYALYLLWAALLVMLGARLRKEFGLPALVTALAVFLLVGAELNALLGILQHFRWHTFLDRVVTMKVGSAVFGNIAQPNHFANYIALGLASLGLLYARRTLRAWHVLLLALPLLFVLPLSGSRGSWFYLLWFAAAAFLWQRRDPELRPLLRYSLLVLAGFGLMHYVVGLPWFAGANGNVTTVQRLFAEDVQSGGIRLYLWHEAWLIFTQFPLLGAGFGQYAWQHFQLGPVLQSTAVNGLYNNAHNLVMQQAAETGLVGLLALFGTLLPWLWRQRRAERSLYHWWGYAVLAVMAMHSLLEYPLWYAYFIGIAALLLGVLDEASYRLDLRVVGRLSVAFAVLLGLLSLQQLWFGYRDLEALTTQPVKNQQDAAHRQSGLAELQKQALLQPYAELFMSSNLEVSGERIDNKLALNQDIMQFVPISPVVYRQSLLLAQAGDLEAAKRQMERAVWSYPWDLPRTAQELGALARKDPAHFAPLLEFALQKYQEYQRAVHPK
jgi:O-antigen ligase